MAGLLEIKVAFPKVRGFKDRDLLEMAAAFIESGLLRAIDRIVARWYSFVNVRTGESGRRSNWNLVQTGATSWVIQNIARTRPSKKGRGGGRKYAGFVHPSGTRTTLENTLVQQEIDRARREIIINLAGIGATGQAPGALQPTAVSFAQTTLDILLGAFARALPLGLAAK